VQFRPQKIFIRLIRVAKDGHTAHQAI